MNRQNNFFSHQQNKQEEIYRQQNSLDDHKKKFVRFFFLAVRSLLSKQPIFESQRNHSSVNLIKKFRERLFSHLSAHEYCHHFLHTFKLARELQTFSFFFLLNTSPEWSFRLCVICSTEWKEISLTLNIKHNPTSIFVKLLTFMILLQPFILVMSFQHFTYALKFYRVILQKQQIEHIWYCARDCFLFFVQKFSFTLFKFFYLKKSIPKLFNNHKTQKLFGKSQKLFSVTI